jgi:hypothetical protein
MGLEARHGASDNFRSRSGVGDDGNCKVWGKELGRAELGRCDLWRLGGQQEEVESFRRGGCSRPHSGRLSAVDPRILWIPSRNNGHFYRGTWLAWHHTTPLLKMQCLAGHHPQSALEACRRLPTISVLTSRTW